MNTAVALVVLGLRASYFVACMLAFFAYGGPALYALGKSMSAHRPQPEEMLPLATWIGACGGIAFIGKRILMAVFANQVITFDRGIYDALGTGLGFALLTAANFLPAWSKARYNGNGSYGVLALSLVVISGIAFATFYGIAHRMMF